MSIRHWWDDASDHFDAWKERQSDDVQELDLLEQIDLYAKAHDA